MVSAHIDEIGLMVTHVDDNGFARFLAVGGVSPPFTCMGNRVIFMNGARGVIGMERLEPGKVPTLDQMYIDTGATSAEDSPVQVGDVCGFERPFMDLGKRLVAKSMDDRIAAVIAIEAMKQIKKNQPERDLLRVQCAGRSRSSWRDDRRLWREPGSRHRGGCYRRWRYAQGL